MKKRMLGAIAITLMVTGLIAATGCSAKEQAQTPKIKFYAIDCGRMDAKDIGSFSRSGEFKGKAYSLITPCFLIRHPLGDMIWDTGLHPSVIDTEKDRPTKAFFNSQDKTIEESLAEIDLKISDIEYLGLSHRHLDHAGNANLFKASTLLVSEAGHADMFSEDKKSKNSEDFYYSFYAELLKSKTITFKTSLDVFGDGTVTIHHMPGHTLGHSILVVKLENSGSFILSGDLYIHTEGREVRAVPEFNVDAEATLRSMDAFEALAKKENARIIIEHELADFNKLAKFPKYLD